MNPWLEARLRLMTTAVLLAAAGMASAAEVAPYFSGDRILIDGKINGEPVRFFYDTGSSYSALFGPAAKRLNVKSQKASEERIAGRAVRIELSQPLSVAMLGGEVRGQLSIFPSVRAAGCDGVFSWRNYTTPHLLIDGVERRLGTPPELPKAGWQHWRLDRETSQLFFVVTKDAKPLGRVFVDTGAICGLRLAPPLWRAWREKNPDAGVTLEPFRYMVGDVMIHELAWADRYRLGDLTLHHVDIGPIPDAKQDTVIDAAGKPYIATIGIRAFRRLRVIVSTQSNQVLTQSVSPIPAHNRLGAVFMPRGDDDATLIARVLKDSPAEKAGLKSGDVLLAINDVDFSTPDEDSEKRPEPFYSLPVGTELTVQVQREGTTHEFLVKLENLLP
jgi:hypothetical protein